MHAKIVPNSSPTTIMKSILRVPAIIVFTLAARFVKIRNCASERKLRSNFTWRVTACNYREFASSVSPIKLGRVLQVTSV